MLDPISLASLIESSISLAIQCGSLAKTLHGMAGKYKNAELTLMTMKQNLDAMQLAWNRIGAWSEDHVPDKHAEDNYVVARIQQFLETGAIVINAIEEALLSCDPKRLGFLGRSQLV